MVLPRLVDWVPAEQRGGSGPAGIHRASGPSSVSVSGGKLIIEAVGAAIVGIRALALLCVASKYK